MAYLCKADRRASIIDAAIEIIEDRSLAAATVREVAKALGASPGQIHHHFASADELRAEALVKLWARITPECEAQLSGLPPRERLLTLLTPDGAEIEALMVKVMDGALPPNDDAPFVRAAVRQFKDQWLTMLGQTLREAQAAGVVGPCDDVPEVARLLAALSVGTDALARVGVDGFGRVAVRDRLNRCIDLLLPQPVG